MQTLHLLGHCSNWNVDAYFENSIGDGFIFTAYSHKEDFFRKKVIYGQSAPKILSHSLLDLQYYGKRESSKIGRGNLSSYSFHPASIDDGSEDQTNLYLVQRIIDGIRFQRNLGLKRIIIPIHYEDSTISGFLGYIKEINRWLKENKENGIEYYMSLPISYVMLMNNDNVERLLAGLVHFDMTFEGYYVAFETRLEGLSKLNTNYRYLSNAIRILSVLKKQKFKTILSYANWDAILFLATTDIDYITIATYENLRNFNIRRFLKSDSGGPSKGWYFSEVILAMIKADNLNYIRDRVGIEAISNRKNIFSDIILDEKYLWVNQKPDIHKNYLLAIDRLLKSIASFEDLMERKKFVESLIIKAQEHYQSLRRNKIVIGEIGAEGHYHDWLRVIDGF
ncbi:hypothetical protein [Dyadobacter sp. 676]|uniref:Uncharacterized protein n=1 Tax=Dyadobacter sp. 676 TaxID=3088362 RepID=A0AAU8FKE8_9BACT